MTQVDAIHRIYSCAVRETVTFRFTQSVSSSRVFYKIGNGPTFKVVGNTFNLPINQAETVSLGFFFVGVTGSCSIQISGSAGGVFPDNPPVIAVGHFVLSRRYTFTI